MKRLSNFILFISFLCAINATAQAQSNREESDLESRYTKREVMIPMRDGIKLYTAIYEPKNNDKHHPILMHRSPYSCEP
jgi:predicted acyl esterase